MVTAWDMNINTGMLKGSGTVPSQSSSFASQRGLAEQLSINQFFMSHHGGSLLAARVYENNIR